MNSIDVAALFSGVFIFLVAIGLFYRSSVKEHIKLYGQRAQIHVRNDINWQTVVGEIIKSEVAHLKERLERSQNEANRLRDRLYTEEERRVKEAGGLLDEIARLREICDHNKIHVVDVYRGKDEAVNNKQS